MISKVDEELTRRLRGAERPVDSDGLFEGLERRRSHHERVRRVQAGLLVFAVLAATAGGFVWLRSVFDADERGAGDEKPAPAANGEIVFVRKGTDGRSHLFAAQPDGAGLRQITRDASNDTDPAVAPDGQMVVFSREVAENRIVIATIPISGGSVTVSSSGHWDADPAWSPIGNQITFIQTGIDSRLLTVSRVNSLEGDQTYDGQPGGDLAHPTWSPDGTRIAFAVVDAFRAVRSWDLAIIRPDGTGLEWLVASDDLDEEGPAWSPDGSRIAFLRPGDEGHETWTIAPDGTDERLLAIAVDAPLEPDIAWAPDGTALLVSDGEWIYRVDATPDGDPRDNFVRLFEGSSPSWQPVAVATSPSPEPAQSPSLEPDGRDIGLGFNLCNVQRLKGIDFLGDGTMGTAWTGSKVMPDGACPTNFDDRYGVAVDFTGDGVADSWSGETIEYCGSCEPFKSVDLNGDDAEELIVVLQYFSIMQYGIYAVLPVEGELQVVPFRTGEPGHPEHALLVGEPFTFWVGGDAGSSDWFYCDRLPELWLTGTESPIDGAADDVTTVHETHVSLGTDAIAHILDARTYDVPYGTALDLQYATSELDCGLGVDLWAVPT